MNRWLLDTGPLVAYFNASDPLHERSRATLDSFRGELVTTSAVVVETMYFMMRFVDGPKRFLEFLEGTEVDITEACQEEPMRLAVALMNKYADIPMDFADASLVVAAEKLRLHDICTTDRRGFTIFRTRSGKRFRLVLGET